MLPTSFPQSNFVFGKPEDWTDEQCYDLPVFKGVSQIDDAGNTAPCIVSKWMLSKEDLELIQQTGCVWLNITGNGMPPVSLTIESPFI